MGADKSAENTPHAPKIFCPICLPKPKSLRFSKKALWVSVVRASEDHDALNGVSKTQGS